MTAHKQSDEDQIANAIMEAHESGNTVIVDLDGRASTRATYSLMLSDLVLVPFRGSMLDADLAARAQTQIRNTEMGRGRSIPYRGVLTNTPASLVFYSRALKNVLQILKAMPFPMLDTALAERQAYRELFSFGGTLEAMPAGEVPGLLQAAQNANSLTLEIERILLGKENVDD